MADSPHKNLGHLIRVAGLIFLVLVLVGLYSYGALHQLQYVNTDMKTTDQSAYLGYARSMVESNYTSVGDRNRMPVYPFILSLFYRQGMSDEEFFTVGKYVNFVLSLILLAGLGWILSRYLPWLETLTLLTVNAFTVFVFKASYVQTELLFYFLSFCLFLLMIRMLRESSWQLSIVTGLVAGAAHLMKASVIPGFAIFLVCAALNSLCLAMHSRTCGSQAVMKCFLIKVVRVLLVAIFFLVTVWPYISTSKQIFGHYFYNVNSTFYIWYDSWGAVKRGTRAHGDRVGWPDMPPEQIRTMSKYLREHSTQQIIKRFVSGRQRIASGVRRSYGYFKYVKIYGLLFLAATLWSWRQVFQSLRSNPALYLFLASYFIVYFLLSSWYACIVSGNRIVLAQFLPLMFVLSQGSYYLLRSSSIKCKGYSIALSTLATMAFLSVLAVDICVVLTKRVLVLYGGSNYEDFESDVTSNVVPRELGILFEDTIKPIFNVLSTNR